MVVGWLVVIVVGFYFYSKGFEVECGIRGNIYLVFGREFLEFFWDFFSDKGVRIVFCFNEVWWGFWMFFSY